MAVNDYESSRERGQPVELYQFIYGAAGQEFLYTDGTSPVVLDGKTYNPLPVERGKIEAKAELSGRGIEVKVPADSDIANLFRIFPPGRVVSVIIRQGHIENPDDPAEFALGDNFAVVWTGRVVEASRDGIEATLNCEALSSGMKRVGLRRHYQWSCPFALYGPECGAAKVAIPATVEGIAGNKITLNTGWMGSRVAANFIGGLVEWAGASGLESRGVLRVEGSTVLVISGIASGLSVTDEIEVFIGCPHTLDGCENLHNNVQNYGGQPWIPTDGNPVGKNNHT